MKLFEVAITYRGVVLAKDEAEAIELKDEILEWESLCEVETTTLDPDMPKPCDWEEGCYVYHNQQGRDILLSEARTMAKEAHNAHEKVESAEKE